MDNNEFWLILRGDGADVDLLPYLEISPKFNWADCVQAKLAFFTVHIFILSVFCFFVRRVYNSNSFCNRTLIVFLSVLFVIKSTSKEKKEQ